MHCKFPSTVQVEVVADQISFSLHRPSSSSYGPRGTSRPYGIYKAFQCILLKSAQGPTDAQNTFRGRLPRGDTYSIQHSQLATFNFKLHLNHPVSKGEPILAACYLKSPVQQSLYCKCLPVAPSWTKARHSRRAVKTPNILCPRAKLEFGFRASAAYRGELVYLHLLHRAATKSQLTD